jgi:hypothetical protein
MKRLICILVVLELLTLQTVAAQADPAQYRHLTGQGSISVTDGCINTFVGIFVIDAWDHQPPGAPTDVISNSVEIIQTDTCAGVTVHHIIGATEDLNFSADNQLRAAEMDVTFTTTRDIASGEILPEITVVARWNLTGALTKSRSHEVLDTDDGMLNVQSMYSQREGTMTVNVSGDFIFEGTGYGFLGLTEGRSVRVP